MTGVTISGIQQLGIGVQNVSEAFNWYRVHLGMDVKVFEEKATASLMLPYTGGKPQERHAILALNLNGGGGFEIWQYTGRTPEAASFVPVLGDLGIFAAKIKCRDIRATHAHFVSQGLSVSGMYVDPENRLHFFLTDPYQNIFQVIESTNWFGNEKKHTGAVYGVVVGVTDMEKSIQFYKDVLGYDDKISDTTAIFPDFEHLQGGTSTIRRVLLKHKNPRLGAFGKLFGESEIELVQSVDRIARKIYENRFWGDLGFIHLCYDIRGMEALKETCATLGYPFTVDSLEHFKGNSFDMGEAAGHFSYVEDPDGTLIEFVETHKVPVLKKIGWYFNLRNRHPEKFLPNWMIKALGFSRVKD